MLSDEIPAGWRLKHSVVMVGLVFLLGFLLGSFCPLGFWFCFCFLRWREGQ